MSTLTKEPEQRVAAQTGTNGARKQAYATPQANIVETKEGYILQAEMPGVSKDGIEVTVENNELVILGHRSDAVLEGTPVYRESRMLDYRRVFDLDPAIDTQKITAKMEQGILTLNLPKAESLKPRRIQITD